MERHAQAVLQRGSQMYAVLIYHNETQENCVEQNFCSYTSTEAKHNQALTDVLWRIFLGNRCDHVSSFHLLMVFVQRTSTLPIYHFPTYHSSVFSQNIEKCLYQHSFSSCCGNTSILLFASSQHKEASLYYIYQRNII